MSPILTNSLGGQKEAFVRQDPANVRIYAHIGNVRPAVIFDVLVRLLRDRFPAVTYARNFTDVDDKINDAARASGACSGDALGTTWKAMIDNDDKGEGGPGPGPAVLARISV